MSAKVKKIAGAKAKKTSERKPEWVQLDYSGDARGVVVTPEDQDRFLLPVKVAVEGCRLVIEVRKLQEQFKLLLDRLAKWTKEHSDDIRRVHIGFRDSRWLFLVDRKTVRFNRQLEDELTALDIEIAQDNRFNLINLQVLSLPQPSPEAVESLLNPGFTLTLQDAERRSPHKAG
jgi:hypothetical protein